ncbi:hypothetical protein [Paracoccus ravus]|uniref:hypothetical protein n=1 Tax=Paracoccus ravus TaxID=2447760 RepID=UPI00106E9C38|nr:hypothetical protein [Paracoccus ravus]
MATTHADPAETLAEARMTRVLFLFVLALVAVAVIATTLWGLPALAMIGLIGTLAVFGMLLAYAAGF